jgi:hypothetical protein
MKLGLIALAATALLCSTGFASAQSNTPGTGTGGTLCSDLLAMDSTSQGAFLQGYQAATQDQLVSAGSGVNATAMSSSSSMVGGTATTPKIGAGTFDTASIISNCQSAPSTQLSQILSGGGVGTASSSP